MGQRPGSIVETLRVDLPRPREMAAMALPAFGGYCNHLRSLFRARSGSEHGVAR